MNDLFLKDVVFHETKTNIRIQGGIFRKISPDIAPTEGETVFDAAGRLMILPPFYNAHTHAAMTLMRGYADDCELFEWLSKYIWPFEAKLTPEDVYNGSRLAILEMIHSGTVFFNDMYWYQKQTVRAAEEMGVRACIGLLQLSSEDPVFRAKLDNDELLAGRGNLSSRIQLAFAPHAIYTVSGNMLRRTSERAHEKNDFIHIHLAETRKEFDDCLKEHGCTPAEYLDSLGLLTPKTLLAHAIYLTDSDLELIEKRGSVVVHMPASNMKLASGLFRGEAVLQKKCRGALGTDGACSNNSLSMFDEMKIAALLAKHGNRSPEIFPAPLVYDLATRGGASAFNLHAGVIADGWLADCMLVRLDAPCMVPNYHTTSNLVYSADPSCIDTVVCGGRILMRHGKVDGEEDIIAAARESVKRLNPGAGK